VRVEPLGGIRFGRFRGGNGKRTADQGDNEENARDRGAEKATHGGDHTAEAVEAVRRVGSRHRCGCRHQVVLEAIS
jgi:hypothetical protein